MIEISTIIADTYCNRPNLAFSQLLRNRINMQSPILLSISFYVGVKKFLLKVFVQQQSFVSLFTSDRLDQYLQQTLPVPKPTTQFL